MRMIILFDVGDVNDKGPSLVHLRSEIGLFVADLPPSFCMIKAVILQ